MMMARMLSQGIVLMIYVVLLAILLFVSQTEYKDKYYVPAKMTCSIFFVGAAALFGFVSKHTEYMYILIVPLVFCALGDGFMGMYQIKHRRRNLVAGIVTFLLAHIGLTWAIYILNSYISVFNIAIPIISLVAFLLIKRKMHIHMGRVTPLACIYSIFLSYMLSEAVQYMFMRPSISGAWIGVGGILFFASDLSIIFLYFYKFEDKKRIRAVHAFNLITYYLATMSFAISILYMAMI